MAGGSIRAIDLYHKVRDKRPESFNDGVYREIRPLGGGIIYACSECRDGNRPITYIAYEKDIDFTKSVITYTSPVQSVENVHYSRDSLLVTDMQSNPDVICFRYPKRVFKFFCNRCNERLGFVFVNQEDVSLQEAETKAHALEMGKVYEIYMPSGSALPSSPDSDEIHPRFYYGCDVCCSSIVKCHLAREEKIADFRDFKGPNEEQLVKFSVEPPEFHVRYGDKNIVDVHEDGKLYKTVEIQCTHCNTCLGWLYVLDSDRDDEMLLFDKSKLLRFRNSE